MAKRKARPAGVFNAEGGWWFRVGTGRKVGPFPSWDEASAAYEKALHARLLGSVKGRGNPRWTRF